MSGYIKNSAVTVLATPTQVGTNSPTNVRGPVELVQATLVEAVNVAAAVSVGDVVYRDSTGTLQRFTPYEYGDAITAKYLPLGVVVELVDNGNALDNRATVQVGGLIDHTGLWSYVGAGVALHSVLYAGITGEVAPRADTTRVPAGKVKIPVAIKVEDNKALLVSPGIAHALADQLTGGFSDLSLETLHSPGDLKVRLNQDAGNSANLRVYNGSTEVFRVAKQSSGVVDATLYSTASGGTFEVQGGALRSESLIVASSDVIRTEDAAYDAGLTFFSNGNTGLVVKTPNLYNSGHIDYTVSNGSTHYLRQVDPDGTSTGSLAEFNETNTFLLSTNNYIVGATEIGSATNTLKLKSPTISVGSAGTAATVSLLDATTFTIPSGDDLSVRTQGGGAAGHVRFREAASEDAGTPNGNIYASVGSCTDYASTAISSLEANTNPSLLVADNSSGRMTMYGYNTQLRSWDGSGTYNVELVSNHLLSLGGGRYVSRLTLAGSDKKPDGTTDNDGHDHGEVYGPAKLTLRGGYGNSNWGATIDLDNDSTYGWGAHIKLNDTVILGEPVVANGSNTINYMLDSAGDFSTLKSSKDLVFRSDWKEDNANSVIAFLSGTGDGTAGSDKLIFKLVGETGGDAILNQDTLTMTGSDIIVTDGGSGAAEDTIKLGLASNVPRILFTNGTTEGQIAFDNSEILQIKSTGSVHVKLDSDTDAYNNTFKVYHGDGSNVLLNVSESGVTTADKLKSEGDIIADGSIGSDDDSTAFSTRLGSSGVAGQEQVVSLLTRNTSGNPNLGLQVSAWPGATHKVRSSYYGMFGPMTNCIQSETRNSSGTVMLDHNISVLVVSSTAGDTNVTVDLETSFTYASDQDLMEGAILYIASVGTSSIQIGGAPNTNINGSAASVELPANKAVQLLLYDFQANEEMYWLMTSVS